MENYVNVARSHIVTSKSIKLRRLQNVMSMDLIPYGY